MASMHDRGEVLEALVEAESWQDVISDEVEARLVRLLGDPGTCPHGNPIPGSSNRPDQSATVRLAEVTDGAVHVVRITEDLEDDDDALVPPHVTQRTFVLPATATIPDPA